MTRGELLNFLEKEAKRYRKEALSSIERNKHMNNLSKQDILRLKKDRQMTQKMIDALLVDFINVIGNSQGCDYGLYVKHLESADRT
ncbi:hypothetical protein KGQ34_03215 [Patescibacteria group bacterium]|nr:hypothetical protein [Patescibacteria group bacterium]